MGKKVFLGQMKNRWLTYFFNLIFSPVKAEIVFSKMMMV